MTVRVLVLHAYSADNAGDGLLVRETIGLVREALGSNVSVVVLAHYPDSWSGLEATFVGSAPSLVGWDKTYLSTLRRIRDFDLVVGVGGGYLRFGRLMEILKTATVHLPQLCAASWRGQGVVYLPQSVGPLRFGFRYPIRRLLSRLDSVMVRDDRSLGELHAPNVIRSPDLATGIHLTSRWRAISDSVPVVSVRAVHGRFPKVVGEIARQLGVYDCFIQSSVGRNDDRAVTATLTPRLLLSRDALMSGEHGSRVVIAVRLHAALMALAAGHYVIHLSYERKGFGAFADMGLSEYVHSVNRVDPEVVLAQVTALLAPSARDAYDDRISESLARRETARSHVIEALRASVRRTPA